MKGSPRPWPHRAPPGTRGPACCVSSLSLLHQYGGMALQMLLGYPYSVFRPVTESEITTFRPEAGSAFATMVMLMIRPPNASELSWTNASLVGASLFKML